MQCIAQAVNKYRAKGYSFSLRKVRGIKDLADALLAFAFPQHQPDGGCMRQHMASRRLFGVSYEHTTTWVRNHWNKDRTYEFRSMNLRNSFLEQTRLDWKAHLGW
jgi:hypothetical protein